MVSEKALYALIGSRLRTARKQVGLTQEQLGRKVGMERTSISSIETGNQSVPLHLLYLLATELGKDVPEILPQPSEVRGSTNQVSVTVGNQRQDVPEMVAELLKKQYRVASG